MNPAIDELGAEEIWKEPVGRLLARPTGDVARFLIVVTIVTIRITIDFIQEVRAQNAVEALRRSVAVQATVRRNGAGLSVPIDRLVPDNIVELIAGDLVRVYRSGVLEFLSQPK